MCVICCDDRHSLQTCPAANWVGITTHGLWFPTPLSKRSVSRYLSQYIELYNKVAVDWYELKGFKPNYLHMNLGQ